MKLYFFFQDHELTLSSHVSEDSRIYFRKSTKLNGNPSSRQQGYGEIHCQRMVVDCAVLVICQ